MLAPALALALLLRVPGAAAPLGWAAVALAFALGDLAWGKGAIAAVRMALSDLAGLALAFLLLARLEEETRRLRRAAAVEWVAGAAVWGGAGAAAAGWLLGVALPAAPGSGFLFRWGAETVSYAALLPLLLSAPSPAAAMARLRRGIAIRKTDLLPTGAVALSFALAAGVEEPGAIALPVLALFWCGVSFPVVVTALVTLAFNAMVLIVLTRGPLAGVFDGAEDPVLMAVRLGVAAVSLGPVVLSILTHHRNALMERLHLQAVRDPLTGLLNREAFREEAALLLRTLKVPEGWPAAAAVLLIELEGYTAVNDRYGLEAGDAVLREVAGRMRASLRQHDLIGRLESGAFAVILRDCPPDPAVTVAERILGAIKDEPIRISGDQMAEVSASIGLTPVAAGHPPALDHLLNRAARALYFARERGPGQVGATGMPEGRDGPGGAGAEAPVPG